MSCCKNQRFTIAAGVACPNCGKLHPAANHTVQCQGCKKFFVPKQKQSKEPVK
jgi:hypothetical protein